MLSNIGKRGKLAAIVLSTALSVTLVSPASAIIPPNAPDGTQDFVSNGKSSMIYGSGSDTTYPMHQALATIFNRAPGCTLQTVASADQLFDMECNSVLNAVSGKQPGFANYDRDLASEYYFIGSGGGRSHVLGWNQGTTGYSQADYFRSSSSGSPVDGRSIAYARDALAAFVFDQVQVAGNSVATPGASVAGLTAQQVKDIWQGTTKCWATIDKTLSGLTDVADGTNVPFMTDGNFDETKWLPLAKAAKGAGYATSDEYKACTPIAVYTVPTTSGTRQAWDSLAAGGTGKGEAFLALDDPFTGDVFTSAEKTQRTIPENNASPIANRLNTDGINTDLVTNSIYFYSIGKYTTALGGLDGNGDPILDGNSTKKTGFTDRLLNVTGGVPATAANIALPSNGYLYARNLFFGYMYPNQATRNYLDPLNGFLCSTKTDDMTDPINSFNVRDQIENAILSAGFIPLPVGAVGGGLTGNSYCRQQTVTTALTDSASPTAGFEINSTTAGATAKKPIFTVTFNELVSGVSTSTIGIQEYSGTAAVGSPIAATLVCTNARQAVIPCLAATSTTNYDLAPLEFVKKVTVQPNADLPAGKTYKAFALGTTGSGNSEAVAIQDRRGLAGWPIVDGNPLVTGTSAAHVIAKDAQTAPAAAASVKAKKSISFSANTDQGLLMTAKTTTPKICTLAISKGNIVVKGVKKGTCKVTLTQAGNATFAALPSTVKTISVK
jgi:ABC-type phosphate transport system substrate-binding protein